MTRWGVAYGITKNKTNATTSQREETALARKDLTKWMRKFVKRNVYDNPMMNDADVSETGLKPHKTTKTKVTKPDTTPLMAYENGPGHSIDAFYRSAPKTKGNKGTGKPDGVALVEIAVWVGDNPPPDPKDWLRKVTGTKNPINIAFAALDAGKVASFAARWATATQLYGEFCDVQTKRIP